MEKENQRVMLTKRLIREALITLMACVDFFEKRYLRAM